MATPSYHPFLFRIFHCKSSIWSTVKPLFKNLLQWELQGLDCWIQPFLSANWNKNPRVPWNSSHWFLFPFNRYQYTKHWLLIYESKKQARKKQATIASATGARTVTRLASLNTTASFANLIPRHNELSIPGMVESVAFALVGMHAPGKTFRDLTSFFSSPRLLCNLPRQNELSIPGMVLLRASLLAELSLEELSPHNSKLGNY